KCTDFVATTTTIPAGPAANVEISDGKATAMIAAPDFFAPRKLVVHDHEPAAAWHPGDNVLLTWEPATDQPLETTFDRDFSTVYVRNSVSMPKFAECERRPAKDAARVAAKCAF